MRYILSASQTISLAFKVEATCKKNTPTTLMRRCRMKIDRLLVKFNSDFPSCGIINAHRHDFPMKWPPNVFRLRQMEMIIRFVVLCFWDSCRIVETWWTNEWWYFRVAFARDNFLMWTVEIENAWTAQLTEFWPFFDRLIFRMRIKTCIRRWNSNWIVHGRRLV